MELTRRYLGRGPARNLNGQHAAASSMHAPSSLGQPGASATSPRLSASPSFADTNTAAAYSVCAGGRGGLGGCAPRASTRSRSSRRTSLLLPSQPTASSSSSSSRPLLRAEEKRQRERRERERERKRTRLRHPFGCHTTRVDVGGGDPSQPCNLSKPLVLLAAAITSPRSSRLPGWDGNTRAPGEGADEERGCGAEHSAESSLEVSRDACCCRLPRSI